MNGNKACVLGRPLASSGAQVGCHRGLLLQPTEKNDSPLWLVASCQVGEHLVEVNPLKDLNQARACNLTISVLNPRYAKCIWRSSNEADLDV